MAMTERNKRYAERHPERIKARNARTNLKRRGLTPESYQALLEVQDGRCAICGKSPGRRRLDIDHDHETGKVRGLLCSPCNLLLGHASDNVDVLEAAALYLAEWKRTA